MRTAPAPPRADRRALVPEALGERRRLGSAALGSRQIGQFSTNRL